MQEVVFTLQTNTPLFLAGADPSVAELRPPSFRGPMRYWYRALVGGLVGTVGRGLEETIKAESNVFGTTDSGSALRIHTGKPSKEFEQYSKISEDRNNVNGMDYLLWSMARSGSFNKGNVKEARFYFPAETDFTVTLSAIETQRATFQNGLSAFWLLTYLGGVGSRSHRCAGSIQVTKVEGNTTGPSFEQAESGKDLQEKIRSNLLIIRSTSHDYLKNIKIAASRMRTANKDFDTIALPDKCRIWVLQDGKREAWKTPREAMEAIGEELQSYRRNINLLDRPIIGLPLISRAFQIQKESKDKPTKGFLETKRFLEKSRKSSPLLLSIHQLQNGHYVGVAVLFKTLFDRKTLNVDEIGTSVYEPDYTSLENWIEDSFDALEVTL